MGHYVYRYMHPDYPWLYVGKTDVSLEGRIKTHDTSNSDNISREYLPLLKESIVLYIELNSSQQSDYVEKYLIDKYKPFLNKKDKTEHQCDFEMALPPWSKYIREQDILNLDENDVLKRANKKYNAIKRKLAKKEKESLTCTAKFNALCKAIVTETEEINRIEAGNVIGQIPYSKNFYEVTIDEVEMFFENYNDSKEHFLTNGYDVGGAPIYFDVSLKGVCASDNYNDLNDDAKRVPIKAVFFSFYFILSNYFHGLRPSSEIGYVLLKSLYEKKFAEEDEVIKSSKCDIKTIDFEAVEWESFCCVHDSKEIVSLSFYEKNEFRFIENGETVLSQSRHGINDELRLDGSIDRKKFLDDVTSRSGVEWYKGDVSIHISNRQSYSEKINKINETLKNLHKMCA